MEIRGADSVPENCRPNPVSTLLRPSRHAPLRVTLRATTRDRPFVPASSSLIASIGHHRGSYAIGLHACSEYRRYFVKGNFFVSRERRRGGGGGKRRRKRRGRRRRQTYKREGGREGKKQGKKRGGKKKKKGGEAEDGGRFLFIDYAVAGWLKEGSRDTIPVVIKLAKSLPNSRRGSAPRVSF